ncbi:MAG: hypothetical protein ABWZ03_07875, partial [Solirubrobacterales bacterium]
MRLSPTPEERPEFHRLLAVARERSKRHLERRELVNELVVGGAFAIAAVALAIAEAGPVDAADALLVFVGLVLGARVVF